MSLAGLAGSALRDCGHRGCLGWSSFVFTVCSGECATVHQGVTPPLGGGRGSDEVARGWWSLVASLVGAIVVATATNCENDNPRSQMVEI